ncbi:unnamed protein product [Ambrosiozyma monospora]|uniref:Unnamed protein product n=1 Tax=Ambrosiozyma monospora TaxID=43982 RepID=A0A9W7DG69_AMBMO|nr:unnamed protein product [Ambrosiozyma monospora]
MPNENKPDREADTYPLSTLSAPSALPHFRSLWQELENKQLPQQTQDHFSEVIYSKLSNINNNNNENHGMLTPAMRSVAHISNVSKLSRKRTTLDSKHDEDEGDTEMVDAVAINSSNSHSNLPSLGSGVTFNEGRAIHIRKSATSPASKRRLIDIANNNNNILSRLNTNNTATSPTHMTVSLDAFPRLLTPSASSSHNPSTSGLPFADDGQQLPLPSPGASPIHSGVLNDDDMKGTGDDDGDDENESNVNTTNLANTNEDQMIPPPTPTADVTLPSSSDLTYGENFNNFTES